MSPFIETRDFNFDRAISRAFDPLAPPVTLPGGGELVSVATNPMTGTPSRVIVKNAVRAVGSLVDSALQYVKTASRGFAAADEDEGEFVPDPHPLVTSSGAAAVHLAQYYHGVPVFEMSKMVRFSPDGMPQESTGNDVGMSKIDTAPAVDVKQAALLAARHLAQADWGETEDIWGQPLLPVAVDVSGYQPTVLASFPMPSRPTVLDKGPFGDPIPANLVIFYQGPTTRLGWHLTFVWPGHTGSFAVIVSADAEGEPSVLYCQETSRSARGRGTVFELGPDRSERGDLPFPRPAASYPVKPARPVPETFPFDWLDGDTTAGNCTIATLASTGEPARGLADPDGVTFMPGDGGSDEQKVLNLFYFCNYMHDFYYMLGFDEEAGNFQSTNVTGLGSAGDPVQALVHPGAVHGTANMLTRPDGMKGLMNMGLVTSTKRHTALDADVVFHEFTHGVTNRLVGGRLDDRALQQPQSVGMGEGWSDYFALTLQNHGRPTERTTLGDWVVDRPGKGIRGFPYDESFPDHFGKLGSGRYAEPHNVGEIWCAALIQMNRELGKALGDKDKGHELGWQIVVDALKLTRANPSFLDARDAILHALDDMGSRALSPLSEETRSAAGKALWAAFAKFGMGPNALSNQASLAGIVADFSAPPTSATPSA